MLLFKILLNIFPKSFYFFLIFKLLWQEKCCKQISRYFKAKTPEPFPVEYQLDVIKFIYYSLKHFSGTIG